MKYYNILKLIQTSVEMLYNFLSQNWIAHKDVNEERKKCNENEILSSSQDIYTCVKCWWKIYFVLVLKWVSHSVVL